MTVCVSAKVNDCIVFAADSAITMSRGADVINVYNNGDKIFNLHRKCPIAAMFCGMGSMDGRSISNISKELRWELMSGDRPINPDDYEIKSIAERAYEFLEEKYAPVAGNPSDSMGYYIGGYGSAAKHGEIWNISIDSGALQAPQLLRAEGDHGINWGGQTSPISRLLIGIDPRMHSELVAEGMLPESARNLMDLVAPKLATPLVSAAMPTADVVRLAEFLVEVTKGYYSFADGSDIVGGPTDIAVISKWEGFKWVKRKHYYPNTLNGSDHGHVC